jgi:TatD DNase family protein
MDDPPAALTRAGAAGVEGVVCAGTDVASSVAALELAGAREGVWATAGLHPHHADRVGDQGVEAIAGLLKGEVGQRLVAVGECGLDYHYDHSPRPDQRQAFAAQVALARQAGLALVIHTREAWDDTFAVLAAEGVPDRTVFHCFTGGVTEARRCLDLGAWLSFSGIASFAGAEEVRAAAALCPAERLLVETDSPYLAPVPHRGRPNQPAWVPLVGDAVAAARGEPVEALAAASWAAARAAYGLEDKG